MSIFWDPINRGIPTKSLKIKFYSIKINTPFHKANLRKTAESFRVKQATHDYWVKEPHFLYKGFLLIHKKDRVQKTNKKETEQKNLNKI